MDAFELAQQVLKAQAFSAHVGAELIQFGDGVAVVSVPFREELTQQNGFLHGGILAFAVDNAVTFAAGTVLGKEVLTSGISVTYLRPAKSAIRAVATVVGSTRRQAVVRCEIYDAEGKLVASGQGTISTIDR
jgi:uncharacterized protein (TIGR00369 family)